MNAGSSGGWATTNDQTRPRPDMASHVWSRALQYGHIGRGGNRSRLQLLQRWMRSSRAAVPSQNPAESSVTAGRGAPPIMWPYAFLSRSALVGTPSPLVTSDVSAPSTWLVDVPLIWRTPSTMRLKPCTYASDMPPPDVLVGRRPLGHSRAPSLVKSPPSPRLQK